VSGRRIGALDLGMASFRDRLRRRWNTDWYLISSSA
jgi:hypothetical protein